CSSNRQTVRIHAGGSVKGSLLAAGLIFGAAFGFLAGLFLAIPTAEIVPGGRPVILGSVGLGALLGTAVAAWRSNSGLSRERSSPSSVEEVMSRNMFKRGSGQAKQSTTTPVWRPADPPAPSRNEEAAEEAPRMAQPDTRNYVPMTSSTSSTDLNALLGRGSE